jgi:hypothetical protein
MEGLPVSEFAKLPYLKKVPSDGRSVVLRPYWDQSTEDWHFYFPAGPEELGRIAGGEPVVGSYLAQEPANPTADIEWPLGTFIARHLSFPHVIPALDRFEHRYYQLCVSLEKYATVTQPDPAGVPRRALLLASELEYVLMNIRALYDLMQKVVQRASALVRAPDDSSRRLIKNLPGSFARILLDGDRLRNEAEIASKFGIPLPIARFYAAEGPRFRLLRTLRDGVIHHGRGLPTIYELPQGAAVAIQEYPWSEIPLWRPENLHDERFGSARAIFAFLTLEALELTTRFQIAYSSCIGVPESIMPGVHLYLRHPFGSWLVVLEDILRQPWENEPKNEE